MPVLDRWEQVRRLKKDAQTGHIPIIGMSAHALDSEREQAIAAGCDGFDVKPIEFESGRRYSARRCESEIIHPRSGSGGRTRRQSHCKHRTLARFARHSHLAAHHTRWLSGNGKPQDGTAEAEFLDLLLILERSSSCT